MRRDFEGIDSVETVATAATRHRLAIILLGLILGLPFLQPVPSHALVVRTASLEVTVRQNGLPLAGWPVRVTDGKGQDAANNLGSTLTGPDGSVTINQVQVGALTVSTAAPWAPDAFSVSQPVHVAPGNLNETTIDIASGHVMGRINALDLPVPGAVLSFTPAPPARAATQSPYTQLADPQGRFSIDLPPGDYTARVTFPTGRGLLWQGPITVSLGQTQKLEPAVPAKGLGTVLGTVVRDGRPVPNLTVTVRSVSSPFVVITTTAQPFFAVPMPVGAVQVEVDEPPLASERQTVIVSQSPQLMVRPGRYTLAIVNLSDRVAEGTITQNGRPVAGAAIRVASDRPVGQPAMGTGDREALTDAGGRYRLSVPSLPNTAVEILSPAGQLLGRLFPGPSSFTRPSNLDWKSARVTGAVTTPDGRPVPDYPVGVVSLSYTDAHLSANGGGVDGRVAGTRTGADGAFALDVVAGRPFALVGGWALTQPLGTFTLAAGTTRVVQPTIPSMPGSIEGTLRLAGPSKAVPGEPLAGVPVHLATSGVTTVTDAHGHFEFDGVPTRPWQVQVFGGSITGQQIDVSGAGNLPPIAEAQTSVAAGRMAHVDLTAVAGRLTAQVMVDGQAPAPTYLLLQGTASPRTSVLLAGPDGTLQAWLPPDTYRIEYSHSPVSAGPGAAPEVPWRIVETAEVKAGQSTPVELTAEHLKPVWVADLGAQVHAGAVAAGDVVLVGADDGQLTAVQARGPSTGAILWQFPLRAAIRGRPLVIGGRVFAATVDGSLHAIDVANPAQEAQGFPVPISGAAFLPPVWSPNSQASGPLDGQVILAETGPQPELVFVDGRTGMVQDSLELPGDAASPPLPVGNTVVVGLHDSRTVALTGDGSVAWEAQFPQSLRGVFGPPTLAPNGLVLQGSDRGTLERLDSGTGQRSATWPPTFVDGSGTRVGAFNGIRSEPTFTANGSRLIAAAGDLGLESFLPTGKLDALWPWTNQDPLAPYTVSIPYRYLASPLDLVAADGQEQLVATATLDPSQSPNLFPRTLPRGPSYGFLLRLPVADPGNGYGVYGITQDQFVGRPVATGQTSQDVVVLPTREGRLYAFRVSGP